MKQLSIRPRVPALELKARTFAPTGANAINAGPNARGGWNQQPGNRFSSAVPIRAPPAPIVGPNAPNYVPGVTPTKAVTIRAPPDPSVVTTSAQISYNPRQIAALTELVKLLADLKEKGQPRINPGLVQPLLLEKNSRIYEMAELPNKKFWRLVEMGENMGWIETDGFKREWIAVARGWDERHGVVIAG